MYTFNKDTPYFINLAIGDTVWVDEAKFDRDQVCIVDDICTIIDSCCKYIFKAIQSTGSLYSWEFVNCEYTNPIFQYMNKEVSSIHITDDGIRINLKDKVGIYPIVMSTFSIENTGNCIIISGNNVDITITDFVVTDIDLHDEE